MADILCENVKIYKKQLVIIKVYNYKSYLVIKKKSIHNKHTCNHSAKNIIFFRYEININNLISNI